MEDNALDFGYNSVDNSGATTNTDVNKSNDNITNLDTNTIDNTINGVNVSNIDGNNGNAAQKSDDSKKTDADNKTKAKDNKTVTDGGGSQSFTPGTSIEVDGETYTVDRNGNLLDKNGSVFKEGRDIQAWLDTFDKVDDNGGDDTNITIDSIQNAIGVQITDDNDKPITFDNNVAGIKAYVEAVIETAKEEHYEAAINTLYQKYPIVRDVLNYYIANGNSLDGYNELPDRSGITIDDTNEAQQEAIIRTAWKEQNRKGDVDNYIAYLKSSGTLLASAKEELEGLQEADKQYREQVEAEAEKRENEYIKQLESYWNGVHEVIKSRNIAGYQIPESIIINRNGQKVTVTPEDFFNYVYRVDENGKSAYERDLAAEKPNDRRDDEILRAYLKFVGGSYSNLVDMAINKQNVATLRYKAKERSKSTVRVNRPQESPKGANIDLGYN